MRWVVMGGESPVIFLVFSRLLVLQVPLVGWELAFRVVSMIRRKNWAELVLCFGAPLIGRLTVHLALPFGISREPVPSCREIGEKAGAPSIRSILHITWISPIASRLDQCHEVDSRPSKSN